MSDLPDYRRIRAAKADWRRHAEAHERGARYHIALNAIYAIACVAMLKMEGPEFADAIVAGLFLAGFVMAAASVRELRRSRAAIIAAQDRVKELTGEDATRPSGALSVALVAFALFYLSAAAATVYLTYVVPADSAGGEDAVASIARRSCSKCDL